MQINTNPHDPGTLAHWKDFFESGRADEINPETEEKEETSKEYLDRILESSKMYSSSFITDENRWRDLSDEDKIAGCTFQTGIMSNGKKIDGDVVITPSHCNLCEKCYELNASKVAEKIKGISESTKKDTPNGQWRMKTVGEDTEAQSLKKRIKRNQGGRHIELATEQEGKSDVWSRVENEDGKSEEEMTEAYGELSEPEDIDFDKLYRQTRKQGKKVSTGKAFRKPPKEEDKEKERVLIPQVVIKDKARQSEAEIIFERTNYIQEAETAKEVIRLSILQFKYIMKELEKANIEIRVVKYTYYHATEEELLRDWNGNVRKWEWLSNNGSLSLGDDLEMDTEGDLTSYLVFPATKKSEPVVN